MKKEHTMNGIHGLVMIGLALILMITCVFDESRADQKKADLKNDSKQAADTENFSTKLEEMLVTAKKTEKDYDEPSYSRLSLPESSTAETRFYGKRYRGYSTSNRI